MTRSLNSHLPLISVLRTTILLANDEPPSWIPESFPILPILQRHSSRISLYHHSQLTHHAWILMIPQTLFFLPYHRLTIPTSTSRTKSRTQSPADPLFHNPSSILFQSSVRKKNSQPLLLHRCNRNLLPPDKRPTRPFQPRHRRT